MGAEPRVSVIFPSSGSMFRRALRSAGSLSGRFPNLVATTARSDFSLPCCHSLALAARSSVSRRSRRDLPSSSTALSYVLRLSDPGGTSGAGPPGLAVPTHCSSDVAFRVLCRVGFHDDHISGPNSAARTHAVYASWPRSPVCFFTATQDSLPAGDPALPDGTSTRWVVPQGFSSRWAYMGILLAKAFLGAHRSVTAPRSERGTP